MKDERGRISDHIELLLAVGSVCTIWFLCNEFLFRLGSVAESLSAGTPGVNVMALALNGWRFFPFIVIIGTFIYALLSATSEEPYNYPSQE